MSVLSSDCFCRRRNEKAIEKLLQFYDPYISKASMRPLFDNYGNVYLAIDMELKGRIREAIMLMIPKFNLKKS